jgi:tetratricopeptide (TPR) repeat protein
MRQLVLCLVLIASVGQARANEEEQTRAAAKIMYRRAIQHYNLAEWEKALSSFTEVYRLIEEPSLLFNIGQCHRQLGHDQEAITFYRSYLRNLPEAKNRDEVYALIAKLEAAAAASSAAKKAPPQEVKPPPPTVQNAPAAEPAPSTTAPPQAPPPEPQAPPPAPESHRGMGIAGIAVAVVGMAALAAGGAVLGLREKAIDDFNHPRDGQIFDASSEKRIADQQAGGIAALAIGGVALTTGAVLMGLAWSRRPTHQARLTPRLLFDGRSAAISLGGEL